MEKRVSQRQEDGILSLLGAPSSLKGFFGTGDIRIGKSAVKAGRGYNNVHDIVKKF